ncbi:MAG: hypothetical protein U1G07_05105 [Verrucomicrobiota bacterium]
MEATSYRQLLEEYVGYTPVILVSPEQVAAYNPALVQDPKNLHVVPFAGILLQFHEAVLSTPDGVHDFLKAHFTKKLRDFTYERPLNVRAHAITGADVLRQLSTKGLIVDTPVRLRLQRLMSQLPLQLQVVTKPHILRPVWEFYTLISRDRRLLSQALSQGVAARACDQTR